ncbi:hypothetical protein [Methanococcoides seepicolus]|uniref:Uncharacterized protein n=1 Tax=Methanococcoides seepicolus TaxID=2828780 RepID=A0A9E4ZEB5_9EURY|nr:hypothetical protein [Methanococcoides seepicolus]MCM1986105.1 hypothetical protein [Methanococcoides seepicolus]
MAIPDNISLKSKNREKAGGKFPKALIGLEFACSHQCQVRSIGLDISQ